MRSGTRTYSRKARSGILYTSNVLERAKDLYVLLRDLLWPRLPIHRDGSGALASKCGRALSQQAAAVQEIEATCPTTRAP
jgi:hypothetical protein